MRLMAPGFTPAKVRMGAALKDARRRAGFSQERAAAAVGTSRRHWIRWESGETMPNPAYLEKIAAVLDAPELADGDEDEEGSSLDPFGRDLAAMFTSALDRALDARLAARGRVA